MRLAWVRCGAPVAWLTTERCMMVLASPTIVMTRRPGSLNQETRYLKQIKETAIDISRALGSVEMADRMAATL